MSIEEKFQNLMQAFKKKDTLSEAEVAFILLTVIENLKDKPPIFVCISTIELCSAITEGGHSLAPFKKILSDYYREMELLKNRQ